ncbi:MAG: YhfT family protein [Bacilli bacterium]
MLEIIVVGALGAICAAMANLGIAVFNDGLRPIIPQYLDKQIGKKELAATSFALSFGLVIGFGIPISLGATIILVHSIFLMTDIIGSWSPAGKSGVLISSLLGAAWGIGLVLGLEAIVDLFALLPINFMDSLEAVGKPVVIGFSVFPVVAIALQHGFKKGAFSMALASLSLFIVKKYGVIQLSKDVKINLSAEGVTLLVGMILMLFFAMQIKGDGNANQNLLSIFSQRVARIKKNGLILCVAGGLVAAATSLLIIAGDPISLALLKDAQFSEATLAAFARGIGFIPLVFSTAIVTGVYSPAGTTFVFVVGIFFHGNPIVAFLVGFIVLALELFLLNSAAKGLDLFPGVRDMGDYIRTAMNKVLEIALLVGGAMACETIAPGIGYFWVIGLYLLNRSAKKPIVDLAMGPIAAISLGVLVNILYYLNLFAPVVTP